jgi:hypothetical protein
LQCALLDRRSPHRVGSLLEGSILGDARSINRLGEADAGLCTLRPCCRPHFRQSGVARLAGAIGNRTRFGDFWLPDPIGPSVVRYDAQSIHGCVMPTGLITVIDRKIWHLNQALVLDPDSEETGRDLDACERIRASLLLAVARFHPRPRRPPGLPKSRSARGAAEA